MVSRLREHALRSSNGVEEALDGIKVCGYIEDGIKENALTKPFHLSLSVVGAEELLYVQRDSHNFNQKWS